MHLKINEILTLNRAKCDGFYIDNQLMNSLIGIYDFEMFVDTSAQLEFYNLMDDYCNDGRAREITVVSFNSVDFAILTRTGKSDTYITYVFRPEMIESVRNYIISLQEYRCDAEIVDLNFELEITDYNMSTPAVINNSLISYSTGQYIDDNGCVQIMPAEFEAGVSTNTNLTKITDIAEIDTSKPVVLRLHDTYNQYHIRQLYLNSHKPVYVMPDEQNSYLIVTSFGDELPLEDTRIYLRNKRVEIWQ